MDGEAADGLLSADADGRHSPQRHRRLWWGAGVLCLIGVLGIAGWYGKAMLPFLHAAPTLDSALYRGKSAKAGPAPRGQHQETVSEALDRAWGAAGKTPQAQQAMQQLAAAIAGRQVSRGVALGDRLFRLLPPAKGPAATSYPRDKNWGFRVALGEIYLQQDWPEAAMREFQAVLAAVPVGTGRLSRSPARQGAAYGMARAKARLGAYAEAEQWLDRAPGEFMESCEECQDTKMLLNYPTRCVWEIAQAPFDRARPQLLQIMVGQFEPKEGGLSKGTGEAQREKAAVEAAMTLGWLYLQHGDRADARRAFAKAAQVDPEAYEAGKLAQAALQVAL